MASGSQGLHTNTTQDSVSDDGSIADDLSECDCEAEERVSTAAQEVGTPEATTSRAGEEGSVLSVSSNGVDKKTGKEDQVNSQSTAATRSDDEGSGWFKIHNLPTKLVASLNKHELVDSWPKLKREIALKIWGSESFEPVPTVLEGAVDRYELGAVLLKMRRTAFEKWKLVKPRCQAMASMYDLIWDHDMTVDAAVEMAAPVRVEGERAPWPNHRFHGLAFKGGYPHQVAVTVSGCHRVGLRALPRPDSIVLNLYRFSGRYRTDRIYVITEVIYAEELHVTVRISINHDDVKILRRVPIGFRLHTYDVRDLSVLTKRRLYDKPLRVRWIGLQDVTHPAIMPRRSRGMGDVSKRPMTIDVSRRNQGLELFPNRNGRQRLVDNGGDHAGQQAAA